VPLAFGRAHRVLCAQRIDEVCAVIEAAQRCAQAGDWVVGFVAYEAAPAFDAALVVRRGDEDFPLAWFAVFDPGQVTHDVSVDDEAAACEAQTALLPLSWQADIEQARFDADMVTIRQALHDGVAYQVNYSFRLRTPWMYPRSAGKDSYVQCARRAGVPYAAFLDMGRWQIVSASPELFFSLDGRSIMTRPMKGTARRGRSFEEDERCIADLHRSEKNRAENLMIVDLLRNDLSRIATPFSVKVPALFAIERYPTLLQMTSTIEAQLQSDKRLVDIFAALFPCGSITGAPKASAMALIADKEHAHRGAYCGALGVIRPGGNALFSVGIRTVQIDTLKGQAVCGVGGGIVIDSRAADEYAEALLKAQFLQQRAPAPFALIETLRCEGGYYLRLERHLNRLTGSAQYFQRPCDRAYCRQRLIDAAPPTGVWRVVLHLGPTGEVDVRVSPAPAWPQSAFFVLAESVVHRDEVMLYHKSAARVRYENALTQARVRTPGAFDVLLKNEVGEITEFSRGNIVLEREGALWTPAQECGLLHGCLRQALIDAGVLRTGHFTEADLKEAQQLWFVNSLRGFIAVRLACAGAAG
jgi:para-aminobenzoate synthetase/4-amino-4-deoxychorismate lyase